MCGPRSRVAPRPTAGRPALDIGPHIDCRAEHERPGGDHVRRAPKQQLHRLPQSPRGGWPCAGSRSQGSSAAQKPRRSGHSVSVVGSRKSRGRSRTERKRPCPPLANCLCFRDGGGLSPQASLRFRCRSSRKGNYRLAALRRGSRDDVAPAPSGLVRRLSLRWLWRLLAPALDLILTTDAVSVDCRRS